MWRGGAPWRRGTVRGRAAGKILRRHVDLAAKLACLLCRGIDVGDPEVDHPERRDAGRHILAHLHAAPDTLATKLPFSVRWLPFAHRARFVPPAEDLLVKGLRFLDAAAIQLGPGEGIRLIRHIKALHLCRLPDRDERPDR